MRQSIAPNAKKRFDGASGVLLRRS